MPEGPELHLSSIFINRIGKKYVFSGEIQRNPVHKSADIIWNEPSYTIEARSRGKELILYLSTPTPAQDTVTGENKSQGKNGLKNHDMDIGSDVKNVKKSTCIQFTFGMSGKFEFTPVDELQKHSHLIFFTKSEPKMALSFVDYRRFGRWFQDKNWSMERGPCVIQEYNSFVKHIADNLNDSAFNKPICEVLLNQKFFNGIGNYLRAEILYRCKIPPFEQAANCLRLKEGASSKVKQEPSEYDTEMTETVDNKKNVKQASKSRKRKVKVEVDDVSPAKQTKQETNDLDASRDVWKPSVNEDVSDLFEEKSQQLLHLCNVLPLEVVELGSKKNSLSEMYYDDTDGSFNAWLQCYYQPGMKNLVDHNKRTIWFTGAAGSMVPREQKVRNTKKKSKKVSTDANIQNDHDYQKSKKKINLVGSEKTKTASKGSSTRRKKSHENELNERSTRGGGKIKSPSAKANKSRQKKETTDVKKKSRQNGHEEVNQSATPTRSSRRKTRKANS